MKKAIAGLLAGLVLGATGTAVAATSGYWEGRGSGYYCEGVSSGVTCTVGNYEIGVLPSYVYVQHRRTEQTFGVSEAAGLLGLLSGMIRAVPITSNQIQTVEKVGMDLMRRGEYDWATALMTIALAWEGAPIASFGDEEDAKVLDFDRGVRARREYDEHYSKKVPCD